MRFWCWKLTNRIQHQYPNPKQIVFSRKYHHLPFPHDRLPGDIRFFVRRKDQCHSFLIKTTTVKCNPVPWKQSCFTKAWSKDNAAMPTTYQKKKGMQYLSAASRILEVPACGIRVHFSKYAMETSDLFFPVRRVRVISVLDCCSIFWRNRWGPHGYCLCEYFTLGLSTSRVLIWSWIAVQSL